LFIAGFSKEFGNLETGCTVLFIIALETVKVQGSLWFPPKCTVLFIHYWWMSRRLCPLRGRLLALFGLTRLWSGHSCLS